MRLLRFDSIGPLAYLNKKKEDWGKKVINTLARKDYLTKILDLKANFSDFYTYHLRELGWEAEEFIIGDNTYIDKVASENGVKFINIAKKIEVLKNKIKPIHKRWDKKQIRAYIKSYHPDVLFIRAGLGIESSFWQEFSKNCLIVSRIAMKIPKDWNMYDWDLIYTSTNAYKTFFELQGVKTIINSNGFDSRILNKITNVPKAYEVSFVGGLGLDVFQERTTLFEYIAKQIPLYWWGYGKEKLKNENSLLASWQGIIGGLEMFEIYHQSKIVLNDYGSIAEGEAVNQRIFEVLGMGTFLLTKYAKNLSDMFPKNILITFKDEKDCLDKIQYFLKNETEREGIAKELQKIVLERYTYKNIIREIDEQLKQAYQKKYGLS